MRKIAMASTVGLLLAFGGASPASAQCPAAPAGAPGRSEFAMNHIVVLAHAGVLGHMHKPGTHQGASHCGALND
jgi:hypothetical protein